MSFPAYLKPVVSNSAESADLLNDIAPTKTVAVFRILTTKNYALKRELLQVHGNINGWMPIPYEEASDTLAKYKLETIIKYEDLPRPAIANDEVHTIETLVQHSTKEALLQLKNRSDSEIINKILTPRNIPEAHITWLRLVLENIH